MVLSTHWLQVPSAVWGGSPQPSQLLAEPMLTSVFCNTFAQSKVLSAGEEAGEEQQ